MNSAKKASTVSIIFAILFLLYTASATTLAKEEFVGCAPLEKNWKKYNGRIPMNPGKIPPKDHKVIDVVRNACITALGRDCEYISGYRSPSYNRKVGGAKRSQHMYGRALDFKIPTSNKAKREKVLTYIICGLGKVNNCQGGMGIYKSGSVHVDTRKASAVWTTGYTSRNIPKYVKPSERKYLSSLAKRQCGSGFMIDTDYSEQDLYGEPDISPPPSPADIAGDQAGMFDSPNTNMENNMLDPNKLLASSTSPLPPAAINQVPTNPDAYGNPFGYETVPNFAAQQPNSIDTDEGNIETPELYDYGFEDEFNKENNEQNSNTENGLNDENSAYNNDQKTDSSGNDIFESWNNSNIDKEYIRKNSDLTGNIARDKSKIFRAYITGKIPKTKQNYENIKKLVFENDPQAYKELVKQYITVYKHTNKSQYAKNLKNKDSSDYNQTHLDVYDYDKTWQSYEQKPRFGAKRYDTSEIPQAIYEATNIPPAPQVSIWSIWFKKVLSWFGF